MSHLGRVFDKDQVLAELRAEVSRFIELLELLDGAGLATRIAACPGWTVTDLARHMGEVHRWAKANLGSIERVSPGADGASDSDNVIAWYSVGAHDLLDALAKVEPTAPSWGFGATQTAEFWFRRQLHETFVHRIDLELASGEPSPRDPAIAADGIAEAFEVMFPRMVGRELGPTLLAPVAFRATDTADAWTIAVDNTVTRGASCDAVIEGPAEALLMLVWQRTVLGDPRLSTSGDPCAVEAVLSGQLTP